MTDPKRRKKLIKSVDNLEGIKEKLENSDDGWFTDREI